MARRFGLLLLLGLVLAACSSLTDQGQERVCRAILHAVHEGDAPVRITALTARPDLHEIRLDYRFQTPDQKQKPHFILCAFADTGLAANRLDVIGVTTDEGVLNEASFYFLKRFVLDDPVTAFADPEADWRNNLLPQVPFVIAYGAQVLIGALPQTAFYALLGASYSLIYGLAGRILFGFGEIALFGGFTTVLALIGAGQWGTSLIGLAVMGAILLGLVVAAFHGTLAGAVIVKPLLDRPGFSVLIGTAGFMVAAPEYLRLAQGNDFRWISPLFNTPISLLRADEFITTLTPGAVLVSTIALVVALILMATLRFTSFGRTWRALSDDPDAAALFGIDPGRMFVLTFAGASAIAGLGGAMMVLAYGGISFSMGASIGLKALMAAVLGGVGSVSGGLLGGLLIGLAEAAWSAILPIDHRDLVIQSALVALIIARPHGLFGSPLGPKSL